MKWLPSSSVLPEADETLTSVAPSFVLSNRSAVLAAVSFSKVTVASWVSPEGVISRLVILPLQIDCELLMSQKLRIETYQKEKKSLTSFSLVAELMFLT